jgi:hypothetical protein
MDNAAHLVLTDVGLRAARDCRSRKVKRRLRAAMEAVLAPEHNSTDLETRLMAAIAGTIRVVDDITADALQRELHALGRLSTILNAGAAPTPEQIDEINKDAPKDPVGILVLWMECCGAARLAGDLPPEAPEAPEVPPSTDYT